MALVTVGNSFAGVAFSPSGKVLAASSFGGVGLWELATGKRLTPIPVKAAVPGQLSYSPDGTILACRGCKDGGQGRQGLGRQNMIVFIDVANRRELYRLEGLTNYADPSFAFSPNSATWACAYKKDHDIRQYDSHTGQLVRRFAGHKAAASTVAFSPDGKTLASTEFGSKALRFWDTATGKLLPTTGTMCFVENLAYSPDGKLLVGGGGGLRPNLWDVAAGRLLPDRLEKQRDRSEMATFSPDGKLLAAVCQHTVYLWDVATGKAVRSFQGHERSLRDQFCAGRHDGRFGRRRGRNGAPLEGDHGRRTTTI